MPTWTCPACGRRFGRARQGHECAPAMPLDEYLATGPAHEAPVVEAVLAFVETLGPVHVEPVSVGILLKRSHTFAELRPMPRWEALSFGLSRRVEHPRISRHMATRGVKTYHVVRLYEPDDVDDMVHDWLSEAYFDVPE